MAGDHLRRLASPYGEWLPADGVYHVREPHLLTQAGGYLKFSLGSRGPIYYRGQAKNHESMFPSLYRGIQSIGGRTKRQNELREYVRQAFKGKAFLTGTPEFALEPLLQHYGIRTKWLDLVDNVWVALWFACHEVHTIGRFGEYLHFRRRMLPRDGSRAFAYIAMLQSGEVTASQGKSGLFVGNGAEVIDLRVSAPSLYLRPHAQHAILMRKVGAPDFSSENMDSLVVGVLRIDLEDALSWLGQGDMLSVHTLFPPPHYDFGYRQLLDKAIRGSSSLGHIHHIGA